MPYEEDFVTAGALVGSTILELLLELERLEQQTLALLARLTWVQALLGGSCNGQDKTKKNL